MDRRNIAPRGHHATHNGKRGRTTCAHQGNGDARAVGGASQRRAQAPTPEAVTRLEDVPLGPAVTVTVERRGDVALIGLNRPFIQNRLNPPTRLRLAEAFYRFRTRPVDSRRVLFGHGDQFSRGIDVDASQAGVAGRSTDGEGNAETLDPLGNSQPP